MLQKSLERINYECSNDLDFDDKTKMFSCAECGQMYSFDEYNKLEEKELDEYMIVIKEESPEWFM